jgi:hypothetical protein
MDRLVNRRIGMRHLMAATLRTRIPWKKEARHAIAKDEITNSRMIDFATCPAG